MSECIHVLRTGHGQLLKRNYSNQITNFKKIKLKQDAPSSSSTCCFTSILSSGARTQRASSPDISAEKVRYFDNLLFFAPTCLCIDQYVRLRNRFVVLKYQWCCFWIVYSRPMIMSSNQTDKQKTRDMQEMTFSLELDETIRTIIREICTQVPPTHCNYMHERTMLFSCKCNFLVTPGKSLFNQ